MYVEKRLDIGVWVLFEIYYLLFEFLFPQGISITK